jgi:hypothetical protein
MQRYFPNKICPRNFPDNKDIITRIENKVLSVVSFSSFRKYIADRIISTLQGQTSSYPRQWQLCKTLLNIMIKENVATPPFAMVSLPLFHVTLLCPPKINLIAKLKEAKSIT